VKESVFANAPASSALTLVRRRNVMSKTERIEYDDDALSIVAAVNQLLKDRKLEVVFVDPNATRDDGSEIIMLKDLETESA
jgi:hypothetical protein